MRKGLGTQRLLALFVAGWLLFDVPLLRVWLSDTTALFVGWALVIAALAGLMEQGDD